MGKATNQGSKGRNYKTKFRNMEKKLGNISNVKFGLGGYNDAMLGLHLSFLAGSTVVSTSKAAWDCNLIEWTTHYNWTEEERSDLYDGIMRFLSYTLKDAKVSSVDDLKGVPVELTFDGMELKSWRVLTEVL